MDEAKINSYVRPLVTIVFAATFCIGFAFGSISAETFVGVASGIVTWWFKTRDEAKRS